MTAALALPAVSDSVTVVSDLLGTFTVEPGAIVHFPRGFLGFPDQHDFALLATERDHVFWLQCVDNAALAFLLVDPFVYFEGYTVDLAATELGRVAVSPDHLMVLAIVTLPRDASGTPTANLQGPVVIDVARGTGHQVVLADGARGVREPFTL